MDEALRKRIERAVARGIEKYGWLYQAQHCVSELGELTAALSEKLMSRLMPGEMGLTIARDEEVHANAVDETADVILSIQTARQILGAELVDAKVLEKLARYEKRIGLTADGKRVGP